MVIKSQHPCFQGVVMYLGEILSQNTIFVKYFEIYFMS
jgi:hypothetical protein